MLDSDQHTTYARPAHLPLSADQLRELPPIERYPDQAPIDRVPDAPPGEEFVPSNDHLAKESRIVEARRAANVRASLEARQPATRDPAVAREMRRRADDDDEYVKGLEADLAELRLRRQRVSSLARQRADMAAVLRKPRSQPAPARPRTAPRARTQRSARRSTGTSAGGQDPGDGDGGSDGDDGDGEADPVAAWVRARLAEAPPFSPGQRALLSRIFGAAR